MFGELIGIWCMEVWQALGRPSPFNLVEVGPGRGTLMKDLLRAGRSMPDFLQSAEVNLIELSPALTKQQKSTLAEEQISLTWISDITALSASPTIIFGNELLDALPARQWIKHDGRWLERAIGIKDGALVFTTRAAEIDPSLLPQSQAEQPDGTVFETAPAREGFIAGIADHLVRHNGGALFIDYGHLAPRFGDTFQAVKSHCYVHPFSEPGEIDLTNHVDFAPLVAAVRQAGCIAPEPVTQRDFLLALGLIQRAGKLGSGRERPIQDALRSAVERLAGTDQMGNLFKVMAFGSPTTLGEKWPGFA